MKGRKLVSLPLLFVSIALLILGYIFLGSGPVDSFLSWKVAPVLLVFTYVVVIPLSVLSKKKVSK